LGLVGSVTGGLSTAMIGCGGLGGWREGRRTLGRGVVDCVVVVVGA
jgi:hypothetical protein